MSTNQEYWDACVIRTWRKAGSVMDAFQMFESITKLKAAEIEPKLLRLPSSGYPWKIGIRVFVASHLSKISKRLWKQSPELDVAMLRKLATSSYDTEKEGMKSDSSLQNEKNKMRKSSIRNEFTTRIVAARNSRTDWNVHQGSKQ